MKLNIGDRVRLVHASEEGIITKIIDNKIVEVEIEDGFRIPVRMSEVAIVSQEEEARFGHLKPKTTISNNSNETAVLAQRGIYTAYTLLNERNGALYLLNNTDFDMPFIIGEERNSKYKALLSGVLKSRSVQKITELILGEFEQWSTYVFQFLFFKQGHETPREPLIRKVRFRASTFFKNKTQAPLLNKEAYLMQIDQNEAVEPLKAEDISEPSVEAFKIDAKKLEASMHEKKSEAVPQKPSHIIKHPPREVDLHIEVLTDKYSSMNNGDMITLQIETFERHLEDAIATGMSQIIFIHGVGNGRLREEIQKKLGGNPDIKFYEDARKERFGYGATSVTLK